MYVAFYDSITLYSIIKFNYIRSFNPAHIHYYTRIHASRNCILFIAYDTKYLTTKNSNIVSFLYVLPYK